MNLRNLLIMILVICQPTLESMANDRPNFILILTDDQGWSGTSVCMDTKIADQFQNRYKTPAIQRLATEGVCFLLDMHLRLFVLQQGILYNGVKV